MLLLLSLRIFLFTELLIEDVLHVKIANLSLEAVEELKNGRLFAKRVVAASCLSFMLKFAD